MAERGRKTLRDEIGVLRRYNDLSEPYFKFIQQMLSSEDKEDRKWAAERLDKAYVKMVPQTINGEGDNGEIILKLIHYGDNSPVQLSATALPNTTSTSN